MVKAVIFDCFGVLVGSGLEPFCDTHFAHDQVKLKRVMELDRLANSGKIAYLEFVAGLAQLAGISPQEVDNSLANNPPNTKLLSYIRTGLKPHYRIGFLSNASEDWTDELFTAEDRQLFDDVVLSFKYGMVKPDADIFELAAQHLGVKAAKCIFVDDIERYCVGARAAGMQAVLYGSFPQFQQDLRALLAADQGVRSD